jgi:hypothetical protein
MADQSVEVTPAVLNQLSSLRASEKFHEDVDSLYPGAPNEEIRLRSESVVNRMLDTLQIQLPSHPQKAYVLSQFLFMLKSFEGEDTEEREEACGYCERVMSILGIESSDGVLNTWLYGFDPEAAP